MKITTKGVLVTLASVMVIGVSGTLLIKFIKRKREKKRMLDRREVGDGYFYDEFELREGTKGKCDWYHKERNCRVKECLGSDLVQSLNSMTEWDKSTDKQCDIIGEKN